MTYAADDTFEACTKVVFDNWKATIRISQATSTTDLLTTNRKIEACVNERIYQELIEAVDYPTHPRDRDIAVNDQKKNKVLFDLISKNIENQTLIFIETRRDVENLYKVIRKYKESSHLDNWRIARIHAGRKQYQRQEAAARFREGEINVMIATSVMSRGLDVSGVNLVINYMIPEVYHVLKEYGEGEKWLQAVAAAYLYRIGRTGRHGQDGHCRSVTFFSPLNKPFAPRLLQFMESANCEIPKMLQEIVAKQVQFEKEKRRMLRNNSNNVIKRQQKL